MSRTKRRNDVFSSTVASNRLQFVVVVEPLTLARKVRNLVFVHFNRPREAGLRLLGRRYDVEAFEEVRLDAMCGRCRGWTHFNTVLPKCLLRTVLGRRRTHQHKCFVEGV